MSRLARLALALLVALAFPTVAADPLKGDGAVHVPPLGDLPPIVCVYVDVWSVPPNAALRDCDTAAANATEGTAARPLLACVSFEIGPPPVFSAECHEGVSSVLP